MRDFVSSHHQMRRLDDTGSRLEPDDKLVFMHFQKTGGSTVHACLVDLFRPEEVCPERLQTIARWPPQLLKDFKYISAHASLHDLRFVPRPVKIVTFLRDPIERSVSLFEYWASYNDRNIDLYALSAPRLAKALGLRGLFATENFDLCGFVWNLYARGFVKDLPDTAEGLSGDRNRILDTALDAIETLDFVGITEDMSASMAEMSSSLEIPNTYRNQRENVTTLNHLSRPEMFDRCPIYDIDRTVMDALREANAIDLEIFRHVVKRFFGEPVVRRQVTCIQGAPEICRVRRGNIADTIISQGAGCIMSGPSMRIFPGRFRVIFDLRVGRDMAAPSGNLGYVDVVCDNGACTLGRLDITPHSLTADTMQVDFECERVLKEVEFRVFAISETTLEVVTNVSLLQFL